jgi:hypothetical protein
VEGERYWLEVANNTVTSGEDCYWTWVRQDNPTGNNYSAGGTDVGGYPTVSARIADLAFCIPGPIEAPPTEVRPCCTCDAVCTSGTFEACDADDSEFQVVEVENGVPHECGVDYVCPGVVAPVNDDCENAIVMTVGNSSLSTYCSTTDGINNVHFDDTGGDDALGNDLWFEFVAPQDCNLRVDMCGTGDAYDSALAVYSNGTGTCVCPTDQATADATFKAASDESCAAGAAAGGAGFVELEASEGQCFMIRVGNWASGASRGLGLVDVSCGAPFCGDDRINQLSEECDGIDDVACPGGCQSDCTCGAPPVCGNAVIEEGEECENNSDCTSNNCDVGAGLSCKCIGSCGDGVAEGDEECDGALDDSCGGEAGRCIAMGEPDECTCPPVECGNNFVDPGEECDGTSDDACPGECRVPGDPAGECTCNCAVAVTAPPAPEAGELELNRFLSFKLPAGALSRGVGNDTAVRVNMATLYDPNPSPNSGTFPDYSSFEGTDRWLNTAAGTVSLCCDPASSPLKCDTSGPSCASDSDCSGDAPYTSCRHSLCLDSPSFDTYFACAEIGCDPEYKDWTAEFDGNTIYAFSEAVVPDSIYQVSHLASSCNGTEGVGSGACSDESASLQVNTAHWGNVNSDGSLSVQDVSATLNRVKDTIPCGLGSPPCSLTEPETTLSSLDPANGAHPTVVDLSNSVRALKDFYYGHPAGFPIPTCP